jgi:hypothetical protein
MNDNLKQLLKEASKEQPPPPTPLFTTPLSEQPIEEKVEDPPIQQTFVETQEEKQVVSQSVSVDVVPLTSWLPPNVSKFENIKMVTISVRDVKPDIDLVLAVSDLETPSSKRLKIIEGANTQFVLNLPGVAMSVFNSGFYILFSHPQHQNMFIKGYSLRNNLIAVLCLAHSGMLLPYQMFKVKKKSTTVTLMLPPEESIIQKLDAPLDRRIFELRYRQSEKAKALPKVKDAVEWMLARAVEMMDINHLIQIDNVLMNTLK